MLARGLAGLGHAIPGRQDLRATTQELLLPCLVNQAVVERQAGLVLIVPCLVSLGQAGCQAGLDRRLRCPVSLVVGEGQAALVLIVLCLVIRAAGQFLAALFPVSLHRVGCQADLGLPVLGLVSLGLVSLGLVSNGVGLGQAALDLDSPGLVERQAGRGPMVRCLVRRGADLGQVRLGVAGGADRRGPICQRPSRPRMNPGLTGPSLISLGQAGPSRRPGLARGSQEPTGAGPASSMSGRARVAQAGGDAILTARAGPGTAGRISHDGSSDDD
jgi:hypothetical protein